MQSLSGSEGESVVPPNIPDHALLRRIGLGSYGEVWLGRNILGELRAIKIIYRSRFIDPRPFEREFEGIQRFEPISRSHPSQLAILHVGKNVELGCFYYIMELADDAQATAGPFQSNTSSVDSSNSYIPHTLRHELEQLDRLPIPECVSIGLSLTTALEHLHEHGLVHRDIKPSNVIFVKGVPKLGDIGLVAEAGDTQSIVGTEGYIPPEGPGAPRADIFSLGKVLYEISTGMDRRRFAELPGDLCNWSDRREVAEFNEILLRACARDPAQRYPSAEEMRLELERLQGGGSIRRARQWERARRLGLRIATGLMVMAILTWLITRSPTPSPQSVLDDIYRMGDPNAKPLEIVQRIKKAALKLDDSLCEAHIGLGWYKMTYDWDWEGAGQQFQRALSLNPTNLECHHFYAEWLRMFGRTNEALKAMTNALALAPRSALLQERFIDYLVAARLFDRAIDEADRSIKRDPSVGQAGGWEFRDRALLALGKFPEGLRKEAYWQARLDGSKQANETPYWQARAYAQLGDTNQALDCLEQSLDSKDFWLTFYVMTDWTLDPIRSEPRFDKILRKMKLK
jgi:tetratricopeptide (TPR) repeat protein